MFDILFEAFKALIPVMTAIISGLFLILANRHKRIKLKLLDAYHDIKFLQFVEKIHVEMNIGRGDKDNKRLVRDIVRKEMGLNHSGISPSKVQQRIEQLKSI